LGETARIIAGEGPRRAAVLVAFVLPPLGLPALALGQSAPQPPPITVQVPPVVTRGIEPAQLPEDPSSFTTVIEVEPYRSEMRSVEDLLSLTPGVQVRRFGGEGQPSEISIRGSTPQQVVIELDGVKLNTAQSGAVDLSTIPLALLDRIEVSRGGGSVQSGTDAIGGVINLITRRPGGETRNAVAGEAGSFGTWRGSAARSGTADGVEYALGYDGFHTDGDWEFRRFDQQVGDILIEPDPRTATRINSAVDNQSGLIALGHSFGDATHLTLRDQIFYTSRGVPGLDSGSVGDAGQRSDAHERQTRNVAALDLETADLAHSGVDANVGLSYLFQRAVFRDPDVVPTIGSTIHTDDTNGSLVGRLGFETRRSLGPTEHRASLGLSLERDSLEATEQPDQTRNSVGVVAQDDASALEQRVRVIPALRFDDTEGFGGEWIPRIGVIVSPWKWLRLKGNLERSYRVPNFDELYFPDEGFIRGNPNLQPEKATNADAGGELGFAHVGPFDDVTLEGAWFHNSIDNSIVFLLVSPTLIEPRNTGPATSEGFELAGGFTVLRWIGVYANHTFVDATLNKTGAPLPGRARDETNVRVSIGPPSKAVQLIGSVQITSQIPVSDTGDTVLPDRTVWNATVAVDLVKLGLTPQRIPLRELLVALDAQNLTDVAIRDAEFFPQPGRSFTLRVEAVW
jgi:vitamin B12 transporter